MSHSGDDQIKEIKRNKYTTSGICISRECEQRKKEQKEKKKKKNVVGALFISFGEKVCEMSCKEDKHSVIVLKCTYREE